MTLGLLANRLIEEFNFLKSGFRTRSQIVSQDIDELTKNPTYRAIPVVDLVLGMAVKGKPQNPVEDWELYFGKSLDPTQIIVEMAAQVYGIKELDCSNVFAGGFFAKHEGTSHIGTVTYNENTGTVRFTYSTENPVREEMLHPLPKLTS